MNIYGWIILAALLANYFLELVSDRLNLAALEPELPQEFAGVYDPAEYARSQQYTRTRTGFGLLTGTFNLLILLLFWQLGGFNALDQLVRGWQFNVIVTGLIFSGLLLLAKTVISLPFTLYSTFVIEEKFGFNRTTPATFVADLLKGLLLTVLLGGPLLAGVLWFFEATGQFAWLWCWFAVTLFTLIVQFVAPTWIMPLFNKFSPLEEGALREAIFSFADSVGFSLQNVFVMDGSKRSSKSNAFFTGFGRNKRIALFDTLINKHSVGELVAVLAHEIGHYQKKHILQGIMISIVHTGVMLYLLSIFVSHPGLFSAFAMEHSSVYAGLLFFGLLFTPLEMILAPLMHMLSRHNEYEADRFAVTNTDEPENMINALKKLAATNLANLTPHPFHVFLHYSHPPLLARIAAIREITPREQNR
ncbi:MAG: M48 family metallopeptidase [Proteobacteria bacterium]|nr:M48 family metallopeptidase [Pseudomonadota bacterium]MBU1739693.1 M48 family metallopeptidase [Pseudomonadota bacterium]